MSQSQALFLHGKRIDFVEVIRLPNNYGTAKSRALWDMYKLAKTILVRVWYYCIIKIHHCFQIACPLRQLFNGPLTPVL
jgi:hypothetical protein